MFVHKKSTGSIIKQFINGKYSQHHCFSLKLVINFDSLSHLCKEKIETDFKRNKLKAYLKIWYIQEI